MKKTTLTTYTQTFSYNKNEIKENAIRPSFAGKLFYEYIHSMNEKGNIIHTSSNSKSKKTAKPEDIVAYQYHDLYRRLFLYRTLIKQNSKEG